ncbi:MAG: hypothetical protein ACOCXJ_05560, partial [Planctomycetota bacterium]
MTHEDHALAVVDTAGRAQAEALREVAGGRLVPPEDNRHTVRLEMPDGSRYPHEGVVNFSDPSFNR